MLLTAFMWHSFLRNYAAGLMNTRKNILIDRKKGVNPETMLEQVLQIFPAELRKMLLANKDKLKETEEIRIRINQLLHKGK